jgi:hypothetical protein
MPNSGEGAMRVEDRYVSAGLYFFPVKEFVDMVCRTWMVAGGETYILVGSILQRTNGMHQNVDIYSI